MKVKELNKNNTEFLDTPINFGIIARIDLQDVDTLKKAIINCPIPIQIIYQKLSANKIWLCTNEDGDTQ